jgi:hypothetical protein
VPSVVVSVSAMPCQVNMMLGSVMSGAEHIEPARIAVAFPPDATSRSQSQ